MRVDGRGERRQHACQHQAHHAGWQQLGHSPDVGRLAVRLHEGRRQGGIWRVEDEQSQAQG